MTTTNKIKFSKSTNNLQDHNKPLKLKRSYSDDKNFSPIVTPKLLKGVEIYNTYGWFNLSNLGLNNYYDIINIGNEFIRDKNIIINISSNNLTQLFPSYIYPNLISLDCSNNDLEYIPQFNNLRELNCTHNPRLKNLDYYPHLTKLVCDKNLNVSPDLLLKYDLMVEFI